MKTLIVGSILVFGSFLAILGNSVVDAIAEGMKNSITQSVTGDLQIYSDKAKEKLSVFGNMDGSPSDIGFVKNFNEVKNIFLQNENVKAILPMGTSSAVINPGNLIDVRVEILRKLYKQKKLDLEQIKDEKEHLLFLLKDLKSAVQSNIASAILAPQDELNHAQEYVAESLSDSFWNDFDNQYEAKLEFISNKIAPLILDGNMLYFGYIGTDPEAFKTHFPQFEIVKGQMIPAGEKGFLIHDYIYEKFVKNRIARRLDSIYKEMTQKHKLIAETKELQDEIKASKEQISELYLTMSPAKAGPLVAELQELLGSKKSDIKDLFEVFLDLNDNNFMQRYQFFYAKIAPIVQLYKINIGEIVPLSAFTKLGSSSSVNIKVWGTFHFKSFENSPLAGNFSIIDMVSFRELYGFLTESRKKQNKKLEDEMGLKDFSKDDLESMFNSADLNQESKIAQNSSNVNLNQNTNTNANANDKKIVEKNELPQVRAITKPEPVDSLTQNEVDSGVFINAAVILKNPKEIVSTLNELKKLISKEKLGLQIVDWQSASGLIGQMTMALKFLLFLFVIILFVVASLMIMNSLLMATQERQQEIGTMRAIGAPKNFIYKSFLYETFLSTILFSIIGFLFAFIVIATVGHQGLPAQGDIAQFFFSGPKLFFYWQWNSAFFVFITLLIISFLATQYPAWKAMSISPLQAMQKKD